jgi:DNA-binding response OmpR family regulator
MHTVMIVEDDARTRSILAATLRDEGFATIDVTNGEDALPIAATTRPDAILLDVGLPGIDGWETMRRLQADGATATIPIVLLTSDHSVDDLLRGYVNGASYFLAKPCPHDEIVRGLRLAISER